MQIASFPRRAMLSSMACLAVPYFPTLSDKQYDFREKVMEQKMLVLILSKTLSKIFLILRRIQRDIINVHRSSCNVPLLLSDFN